MSKTRLQDQQASKGNESSSESDSDSEQSQTSDDDADTDAISETSGTQTSMRSYPCPECHNWKNDQAFQTSKKGRKVHSCPTNSRKQIIRCPGWENCPSKYRKGHPEVIQREKEDKQKQKEQERKARAEAHQAEKEKKEKEKQEKKQQKQKEKDEAKKAEELEAQARKEQKKKEKSDKEKAERTSKKLREAALGNATLALQESCEKLGVDLSKGANPEQLDQLLDFAHATVSGVKKSCGIPDSPLLNIASEQLASFIANGLDQRIKKEPKKEVEVDVDLTEDEILPEKCSKSSKELKTLVLEDDDDMCKACLKRKRDWEDYNFMEVYPVGLIREQSSPIHLKRLQDHLCVLGKEAEQRMKTLRRRHCKSGGGSQ